MQVLLKNGAEAKAMDKVGCGDNTVYKEGVHRYVIDPIEHIGSCLLRCWLEMSFLEGDFKN